MSETIHVGKMIKFQIDSRNLLRTQVASMMNTPSTAIYSYEKRQDLKTSTIMRICKALRYNFFMDIANSMPRDYAYDTKLVSEKDELIRQQAEALHKLKLENDLLKEIVMGKMS